MSKGGVVILIGSHREKNYPTNNSLEICLETLAGELATCEDSSAREKEIGLRTRTYIYDP
jgi:hypothetical protein